MSRSALILGALPGQADAMHRLRTAGWKVYACGHKREGAGVEAADEFFVVDILDPEGVAELAERLDVDLVYSVGSDIAMPTVAAVSERLGLPLFHSSETTQILHRKDLLRTFLSEHDLSPVAHRIVLSADDLADFPTYPAIVKPVDSQGQRGITIVQDHAEAVAALPDALAASHSGRAVLEELLIGPEVTVHVFVVDGVVKILPASDRVVWEGPLTGIPAAHVMPPRTIDAEQTAQMGELIERFVAALGVSNGPLYFQLIFTAAGPRIVEVAPRLDGCHLWRLLEVHTGFDILSACFTQMMGDPWPGDAVVPSGVSHTLRFHLTDPAIPFDPAAHSFADLGEVVFEEFHVEPGEVARDTNGHVARLGYAITEDNA